MPPSKLSHLDKLEVIRLHELGWKPFAIRKELTHDVPVRSIRNVINSYVVGTFETTVKVSTKQTASFRTLTRDDIDIVKETIQSDCTKSAREVKHVLAERGTTIGLTTVKKAIRASGFTAAKPRYCQLIRDANKEKRVNFCDQLIATNDKFDDVIFSDETTIQLHDNKTVTYRPLNSQAPHICRPKHPLKLHVWAGISRRGATNVMVFEGIMRSDFYVNQILGNVLLPFVRQKFADGHRFMQDNDPKHKSRLAQQFMTDNNINWWNVWPAESCDLNPIEMTWNMMKRHVTKENPTTKEELKAAVQKFWREQMTIERCNTFIDHVFMVVPVVKLLGGRATGDLPNRLFRERPRRKSIAYFNNRLQEDSIKKRAEQLLKSD